MTSTNVPAEVEGEVIVHESVEPPVSTRRRGIIAALLVVAGLVCALLLGMGARAATTPPSSWLRQDRRSRCRTSCFPRA